MPSVFDNGKNGLRRGGVKPLWLCRTLGELFKNRTTWLGSCRKYAGAHHKAFGTVNRTLYSTVQFTGVQRKGTMPITERPVDVPVLVEHIVLEMLDLCVDIRKGLIYNPDTNDEWIEDQL